MSSGCCVHHPRIQHKPGAETSCLCVPWFDSFTLREAGKVVRSLASVPRGRSRRPRFGVWVARWVSSLLAIEVLPRLGFERASCAGDPLRFQAELFTWAAYPKMLKAQFTLPHEAPPPRSFLPIAARSPWPQDSEPKANKSPEPLARKRRCRGSGRAWLWLWPSLLPKQHFSFRGRSLQESLLYVNTWGRV